MKTVAALALVAALAGCATSPFNSKEVVVSNAYVVRTAPDALKTLPPLPAPLANPKSATNSQIAVWINNTEEYVANLEGMIQNLVNFYEKPVTTAEAGNLTPVTPLAKATPNPDRLISPQAQAAPASAPVQSKFTTALQRLRGE